MRRIVPVALTLCLTACGGETDNGSRAVKSVAASSGEGAQLFTQVCSSCHEVDGGGKQAVGAPAIANLPGWYVTRQLKHFRDGIRGAHEGDTEGAMMATNAEPLSDTAIAAVADYVTSLPVAEPGATITGDVARGRDVYSNLCSACHASNGLGNEALGAPPLAGVSDWYLERQYEKFRASVRGYHPSDTWGAQMVRFAPVIDETDTLRNIIAFIANLPVSE